MKKSLSVLLPVHNVEMTVSDTVHQTLEIASDLAERFELLIIDDGSSDEFFHTVLLIEREQPGYARPLEVGGRE